MTVRERNLLVVLAGAAGAVLAGILFMQWFWNPWDPLESTCRHASLSIL